MPLVRGFRSPTRGLAPMDAPNGSFIAYSTAPGSVAADGSGANSPFVTALVKNLRRKGELIESIFRDVRREVLTSDRGNTDALGQLVADPALLLRRAVRP